MAPMTAAPIWQWTAVETAAAIRTGRASAVEVVAAHQARLRAANPAVNAVVVDLSDAALKQAEQADAARARGEPLGPLHGVPVTIKINIDVQGQANSNGVAAFKDNIAPGDSPVTANLKQAGAIILGLTNTPEFSMRGFTDNPLHGQTLNPWNPALTCGGSSGGAGASVALGIGAIAHGNDIGGSLRWPAFCCGVTGLRPTAGRIPTWYGPVDADQSLSLQTMMTQGPLARCVADLRLALAAMSRFDPRDALHAPAPLVGEPLPRPIRVGLLRDAGAAPPSPAVDAALATAARWLSEAGYRVEEVEDPVFGEAYRLWYLLVMEELRLKMPMIDEWGDAAMKKAAEHYYAVAREWWGPKPDLAAYIEGYARRGTLIARLQRFLEDWPLLLLPVSAEQAFEQDADIASVDGMRRVTAANWSMMAIALLGFPALAVPTGLANGLPVGVQILGRRFREDTVLEAGEVIEERAGVLTPINPR